jgi:hypothetical protein
MPVTPGPIGVSAKAGAASARAKPADSKRFLTMAGLVCG